MHSYTSITLCSLSLLVLPDRWTNNWATRRREERHVFTAFQQVPVHSPAPCLCGPTIINWNECLSALLPWCCQPLLQESALRLSNLSVCPGAHRCLFMGWPLEGAFKKGEMSLLNTLLLSLYQAFPTLWWVWGGFFLLLLVARFIES